MIVHNCKQGSQEWSALRRGIPTASEFDRLISPLGKIRTGEKVDQFLYEKLAEKTVGWTKEFGGTYEMDQGHVLESVALPWYEFSHDVKLNRVGFCTTDDGLVGCSPDALIGEYGGLEVKSPQPPKHLAYLAAGVIPPEYVAQVQGCLWVTKRDWWKFVSYSHLFPALEVHVEPDPEFQAALGDALNAFYDKFHPAYARIKAMQDEQNAAKAAACSGGRD